MSFICHFCQDIKIFRDTRNLKIVGGEKSTV